MYEFPYPIGKKPFSCNADRHFYVIAARLVTASSVTDDAPVVQNELSSDVTVSDTIEIRPGENNETGIVVCE